ncbi:Protein CBG11955 [Caenorhabditis briggsae]|uniref:Protein CBG11955 n=1 Tax=Caenorhabditis briggsae TaxID=6238 RepID=A8XEN8_CAEBR|nr:Protein CBG11955 [Caenorhabditis briggsae]CAP31006.1 Protein CBG11955 [Caenorhabditis briggsae]
MRDELSSSWFPYNSQIARALLRDKHVMFIGDSLVRGMYKDMLALLQTGNLSQIHELRVSNEDSIHGDKHIDFIELAANRVFRQAREFQSNQHLIQYFFTNRAMRDDLDKTCLLIEATDERPDVVVINSAIWDISRYPTRMTRKWTSEHMDDLEEEINVADDYFNRIVMFCRRMRVLLPPSSTELASPKMHYRFLERWISKPLQIEKMLIGNEEFDGDKTFHIDYSQLVRREVFEDYKLPNSQCEMSCLHQILRFLLAFFRFEEASKSNARGISNAFSAMPNELSRYSQEDLQRISEIVKQCSALKSNQLGILMKTTSKRVHEMMVNPTSSPDAPPGIRIRMDDDEEAPIDGNDELEYEDDDMNIVVSSDESVYTLSPPRSSGQGSSSDGYSNGSPARPEQNKRFRYQ